MVFANGIDENIVMGSHRGDASSPTSPSPVPLADNTPNAPVIASAVVVPDAELSIPTGPSKRRQSSASSPTNTKRPRLDTSQSFGQENQSGKPSSAQSPPSASPNAGGNRASFSARGGTDEDRRRGKRLFGGLLGTLAQGAATSRVSKKKQDVEEKMLAKQRQQDELERKQREKLKLEDQEREELKRLKRAELNEVRKVEQKVWDEQSLRIRHDNMRATARFLETEASPKLHYKPWDLLPRQADQIKTQIAEVEKTISQELPAPGPKRTSEEPEAIVSQPDGTSGEEKTNTVGTNSQDQTDTATSAKADVVDTNTLDTAVAPSGTTGKVAANEATNDHADENDEVVEAGEDTVIY